MNSAHYKKSLFWLAFCLVFSLGILLWWAEKSRFENSNCPFSFEERLVRGDSLAGLLKSGNKVKIFWGYYNCREVNRGDIVVYAYAQNKPLIKIVKGIPGDKFALKKTEDGWQILLNGETVKNSLSQPYHLDENGYRLLSLYERDYGGIIPRDTYLILGNLTSGSWDSTRYGLVHKSDILGKVEY